jgi:hypothetical protein
MASNLTITIKVRVKYKPVVFFIALVMYYSKLWSYEQAKKWFMSFMEYKVGRYDWRRIKTNV